MFHLTKLKHLGQNKCPPFWNMQLLKIHANVKLPSTHAFENTLHINYKTSTYCPWTVSWQRKSYDTSPPAVSSRNLFCFFLPDSRISDENKKRNFTTRPNGAHVHPVLIVGRTHKGGRYIILYWSHRLGQTISFFVQIHLLRPWIHSENASNATLNLGKTSKTAPF